MDETPSQIQSEIQEIVDRETRAWDTQDVQLLLSVFHPDMVWPWPRTPHSHDPIDWVLELGRFDARRWGQAWQTLFDTHTLIHNHRTIRKIETSPEGDGAFAVVDIDTLWRDAQGNDQHWKGRVCKAYARVGPEWKMTMQTGALDYASLPAPPLPSEVEALLSAAEQAMGGAGVLSAVQNIRALAWCTAPRGEYQTEVISARGGRLMFVQTWPNRDSLVAFTNGPLAWVKDDATGQVERLEPASVAGIRSHEFQMIPLTILERYRNLASEGTESFAGKQCEKVSALDELGLPVWLYFDSSSSLLAGIVITNPGTEGQDTVRVVIDEWRAEGGVHLPSKITATDASGDFTLDFREITLNETPDDLFAIPPEIANGP